MAGMTTNKASAAPDASGDLRAEYHLDYARSRPNRFASRISGTAVAVVLEPDVAAVFDTSESVNRLLRSVISALPAGAPRSADSEETQEADSNKG